MRVATVVGLVLASSAAFADADITLEAKATGDSTIELSVEGRSQKLTVKVVK